MARPIAIAAQASMDLFYTNYKTNSDFFDLEDFITHCSGVLGAVYMDGYERMRAGMRQEKRDAVVSFDPGILVFQSIEVKGEGNALFATLESGVMSFPYDEQGVGVQDIIDENRPDLRFERTTFGALYQLKYVPVSNVIWWYFLSQKITFINKTTHRLTKLKALTVPSISDPNLMVPDGIFEHVVTTGAMTIKEGGKGAVVKKSLDGNQNKLIQTEADLSSLK